MKLTKLFESSDKKPNPMAKALSDPKFKPKTETDKKKEAKKGYKKHKGKIEEAGYEGQVEPTHHDFKNVNLDSIKKIIADRDLKADAEEVDGAIRVHTMDSCRKSVAKSLGINEELYINGMSDVEDVINMIKDTIDDGNNDGAKDYLEQFKEYLHSKGITDSVDPLRTDRGAAEELAQEIYNNSEYYQQEYEDWEAFMNSDDFEEENMRLWSKFGESKIKPYVSMYNDKDTGKMTYDVLDGDGKSAFKTIDKKAAMGFFNKNFDALRKGFDSLKDENVSAIAKAINSAYDPTFGDTDNKFMKTVKSLNPFKSDDQKKLQMAKQAERDNPNWRGEPGDQAGQTLPNGRRAYYRNVNGQKQRVDIYKDIYPESSEKPEPSLNDLVKQDREENPFTDKEIKMAFGVLNDPRFKGGNYSGAVNVINKIAPDLADHPSVANALKRANENLTEDQMSDEVKAILDKHGIKSTYDIEYGSDAFSDLFDYFSTDPDEMPYGVQKARTGMPDEWIADRLIDLGLLKEVEPAVHKHQPVPGQQSSPAMEPANPKADVQSNQPEKQKGPDDTKLRTNVSLQQIANLFPGVENKQVFLQSLLRLKQGQKISMQHAYTLADAFKELISKDPQDTQRAMIQLKKIGAQESVDETTEDDAPGYPYTNKTMNQGKTPDEALKDERTENSEESMRLQQLAGLFRSDKD